MKNVLFLSVNDWSNSGYKMCEAVNRHSTKYHIDYFCVNPHVFGYYRGDNIICKVKQVVDNKILNRLSDVMKKADLIHFKENNGAILKIADMRIDTTKPTVCTLGGSVFRAYHEQVYEQNKKYINKFLVTTPDLLFPEMDNAELLPFALDTDKYVPSDKSEDCVVVGHIPTNAGKGSDIVEKAISELKEEGEDFEVIFVTNAKHRLVMQMKRLCHIYIDQINKVGSYGNSAVESMALGSIIISGVRFGNSPVLRAHNVEEVKEKMRYVLQTGYDNLWQEYRDWAVKVHSYQTISKKVDRIYDEVLNDSK